MSTTVNLESSFQ